MSPSPHLIVRIDLQKLRANAQAIRALTKVPLLAVVKADAYGLGASQIVKALADIVDGFCVFSLAEAVAADIWLNTHKPSISLGPEQKAFADDYISQHVRPAVWDISRAKDLQRARPVLSVDTGMQRFACPADQLDAVMNAVRFDEAFTHATSLDRVARLLDLVGNRGLTLHAAGSSLLHEPAARLDAVRPGLALYEGAARISTRLIDARKSNGPIGYSGFIATHHGVILAGYSNGLRRGPCLINNRPSRILEVGMQTAYVETADSDKIGDEVVLLGDSLRLSDIAATWKCSPHEVLSHLSRAGTREYA